MSTARLDREPYRIYKWRMLQHSNRFERYVVDALFHHSHIKFTLNYSAEYQVIEGEGPGGFEIKHDCRMKDTGNLYIETREKYSDGRMMNSGILTTQAWLYIIGDHETIYCMASKDLKTMVSSEEFEEKDIASGKGTLIPIVKAAPATLFVVRPTGGAEARKRFDREVFFERQFLQEWLDTKSDEVLEEWGTFAESQIFLNGEVLEGVE